MTSTTTSSNAGEVRVLGSSGFHGLGYGMGIAMGILLLVTAMTLFIYCFLRWKNKAARAYRRQNTIDAAVALDDLEQGIDEETLKSYPKVMYGEDEVRSVSNDITCSICLSNYKDAQILRLLPDCGHMFHVECVDEWLRRHPTCPVCRCTPLPSISMTPLADSHDLSI